MGKGTQNESELPLYSMKQVAAHNTEDDLWMVINDRVYDLTKYLPHHPGGKVLRTWAGTFSFRRRSRRNQQFRLLAPF